MELFILVQTPFGESLVAHTAPSDWGRCVEYVEPLAMRVANSHPSGVTVAHSPSVSSSHATQKKQKNNLTSLSWKDEGRKKKQKAKVCKLQAGEVNIVLSATSTCVLISIKRSWWHSFGQGYKLDYNKMTLSLFLPSSIYWLIQFNLFYFAISGKNNKSTSAALFQLSQC